CHAAKEGARALVVVQGPPRLASLLNTYSEHLHLPLVVDTPTPSTNPLQVSLLPDTVDATAALLRHYQWNSFAFIYDTDHGADKLQEILKNLGDPAPEVEAFWRAYNAEEASAFARQLPPEVGRLLLDVSEKMADQLFSKLSGSGRSFHGILIRPVGVVQRGSTQGISKLTKFSVVDEGSDLLKDLENRWKTLEDWARRPSGKDLPDSALLSHDASRMLHTTFTRLSREFPETLRASVPTDVDCFNYSSGMPDAAEPFQRNVVLGHGVTGNFQFDEQGLRVGYSLNIIESTPFSLNKIGDWSDATGLKLTGKTLPPITAFQKRDLTVRVTSILKKIVEYQKKTMVQIPSDILRSQGLIINFISIICNSTYLYDIDADCEKASDSSWPGFEPAFMELAGRSTNHMTTPDYPRGKV
ncbi:Glutamate receptor 2, partial [Araneus ventricosus]